MAAALPTIDDIRAARGALRPVVCETPLLESPALNARAGARLLVKAEALQHTGSFKFRGAYYRLSRLCERERAAGVVAYSSGNFGRALASAGSMLDVPVTIVTPIDAPPMKIAAIRDAGAEVVLSDHGERNREEAASELAGTLVKDRGATALHPFDDPLIVAGQGTVALEIIEQAKSQGAVLDMLLVPVGGGGLIAGCALATASQSPETQVIAVEPAGYDGMGRSLDAGERRRIGEGGSTLCDALQAAMPGAVPFAVAQPLLKGAVAVADKAVVDAVRDALAHLKIVLEPSGAIALAAALGGSVDLAEKCVGVVATGGNIAPDAFADLI
jgi:threonine dehydratase